MARKCVFCGGSPVTGEHVWPDWLRRHTKIETPLEHRQHLEEGGQVTKRQTWKKRPYTMRVNAVCAQCNNGWMSDLEGESKRLLVGMIEGRGKELHRGGQRALASWALKTAMMMDQADPPRTRSIPERFYRDLMEHREAPAGVWVWMSAYAGSNLGVSDISAMEFTDADSQDPPERNVSIRTFTIGLAAFQVLATTSEQLTRMKVDWRSTGNRRPPIWQLWPFEGSFVWRPAPGLADKDFYWFSNMIKQRLIEQAAVFEP